MNTATYHEATERFINSAALQVWGKPFTREGMGGGSSALVFRFGSTKAVYVSNGDCEALWREGQGHHILIQVVEEGVNRDELNVLSEVSITCDGAIDRSIERSAISTLSTRSTRASRSPESRPTDGRCWTRRVGGVNLHRHCFAGVGQRCGSEATDEGSSVLMVRIAPSAEGW